METNLLILGTLFILTLFSVGESLLKHFGISKRVMLAFLTLLIVSGFLPTIEIGGIVLAIDQIIFPFVVAFGLLFKVKSFPRFVFSMLVITLFTLLAKLSDLETINFVINPLFLLSVIFGIFIGLNSSNLPAIISSTFLGVLAGNMLFNFARFDTISGAFYDFSSFTIVLIVWLVATVVLYSKQRLTSQQKLVMADLEKY